MTTSHGGLVFLFDYVLITNDSCTRRIRTRIYIVFIYIRDKACVVTRLDVFQQFSTIDVATELATIQLNHHWSTRKNLDPLVPVSGTSLSLNHSV